MADGWYFPSNNYGTVTGIGEAGIETFRGSPYCSLAREICQNSMDARNDYSKPVIVEFSSFSIPSSSIPKYNTLYDAVNSCLSFWAEQHNKKTVEFFKKAKATLDKSKINVLRISDYNTTGLQGSDKEFNTPWHNLVKASGVSGKEGSAGGSYGIGKAAPFVCSDIRTLFYATKDIDGLSAFQGIAKLVSFREKGIFKDKDSITSGTGYYSADKKNNPLRKCISIDPSYARNECGTDIFVVGFRKNNDWKTEIISSVLEEFLIAIFKGELIVKIDDIEIDARNLESIVEEYKDKAKFAYNYYQVLTDEDTAIIEHEFPGLGTIELRALIKQELHRKVMMCRRNGMKIFDKANISGTIQFAGICTLKDENINEYFREMENPQHNAWEPERHTTDGKTKAKGNISMLYKFVKNSVIELGKKTTVDEIDAEGMGEYFADSSEYITDNQEKSEAISSSTSNIEINVSEMSKEQIGYEKNMDEEAEYGDNPNDDELNDEAYGDTGANGTHSGDGIIDDNDDGNGNEDGNGKGPNGIGDNLYATNILDSIDEDRVKNISTMSVRIFIINKEQNIYKLIFVPKRNSGKGFLQISLSGEQKNVKASIIEATDLETNTALTCKGNKILLENIEKNYKNKIKFRLNYIEECSLEVKLYGYSS